MRFVMTMPAIALLASMSIGCASEEEATGADNSAISDEPSVSNPIAECDGRKACVDAVVLAALFSSTTIIKNGLDSPATGEPVNELVARWLGATETKRTIAIKTTPRADNETSVELSLFDSDPETASTCTVRFTLAGDRIAESELDAICPG
jgi:hypothetical protein